MLNFMTDEPKPVEEPIDAFLIDEKRLELSYGNCSVRLTKKELEIIKELVSFPGRVFSRQELLKRVWGDAIFVDSRTVDAHVVKLRRKLMKFGAKVPAIETVWGLGYRLDV